MLVVKFELISDEQEDEETQQEEDFVAYFLRLQSEV
jgi:hypothetical protein